MHKKKLVAKILLFIGVSVAIIFYHNDITYHTDCEAICFTANNK